MSALLATDYPLWAKVFVCFGVAFIVALLALGWIAWTWYRAGKETDEELNQDRS